MEKVSEIKDGARPALLQDSYTNLPDEIPEGSCSHPYHSPVHNPLTSSSAKAKMQLDTPPQWPSPPLIEPPAFNPILSYQALHSSMASFPTSGLPVLDSTLKDMLLSLQTSLMTDLASLFTKITSDIHSLDDRVSNFERDMKDCVSTVNKVIDVYEDIREEQTWMLAKLADLEDRSRRNNVKLRGIPESILPADLPKYARDLMHIIIPEVLPRDILIDRIHRIAKPSHLATTVPRDVLNTLFPHQGKTHVWC